MTSLGITHARVLAGILPTDIHKRCAVCAVLLGTLQRHVVVILHRPLWPRLSENGDGAGEFDASHFVDMVFTNLARAATRTSEL